MEEKKIVYDVILSIWNLIKEHGFKQLSDEEWEHINQAANIERNKYKEYGTNIDLLFRELYFAVQNYYERKAHEE